MAFDRLYALKVAKARTLEIQGRPVTLSRGTSSGTDTTFSGPEAEVLEQLERILAHSNFQHGERYKNFLRYIVENTLESRFERLKERIIGSEVLGRSPDFDTSNDPSVRVVAGEVRKRLALYYSEAEHAHELQIKIPVRAYIAEFTFPNLLQVDTPQAAKKPQHADPRRLRRIRFVVGGLAAVAVISAAICVVLFRPTPAIDKFWSPFVSSSGNVAMCLSAHVHSDDGKEADPQVSFSYNGAGRPLTYEGYRNLHNGLVAATDVIAFSKLASYMQRKRKNPVFMSAQTASLSDLNGTPVILIGSFHNDWSMRFEAEHRFQFQKDSARGYRWIEDTRAPNDRKWMLDEAAPFDQVTMDYLLISRVLDQTSGQWWMDIAGLTSVGAIVGSQLVTDPKTMEALAKNLPKGWENKNLQMVLGFKVVQGSPGTPRLLAYYSW